MGKGLTQSQGVLNDTLEGKRSIQTFRVQRYTNLMIECIRNTKRYRDAGTGMHATCYVGEYTCKRIQESEELHRHQLL